ncbi:Contig_80, whole genome shotgun sequence [Aeromonas veronii]|uniref:Contig_80, whole genome shotgun sequence n=1 Tax=Aeromonas veronii TaxID=654 RepID=A0A653KX57_AERVE|nr:Contig_80, whole genome shotgun sequence [Aeromonas veronii]
MKVHLKEWADVRPGYQQEAYEQWDREGLEPYYVRKCDQLMVKQKHASSLTDKPEAVTCKHCLKAMAKR